MVKTKVASKSTGTTATSISASAADTAASSSIMRVPSVWNKRSAIYAGFPISNNQIILGGEQFHSPARLQALIWAAVLDQSEASQKNVTNKKFISTKFQTIIQHQ